MHDPVVVEGKQTPPVGAERQSIDAAVLPRRDEDILTGPGVPHPNRAVLSTGGDPVAVRADGHAPDFAFGTTEDQTPSFQLTVEVQPLPVPILRRRDLEHPAGGVDVLQPEGARGGRGRGAGALPALRLAPPGRPLARRP